MKMKNDLVGKSGGPHVLKKKAAGLRGLRRCATGEAEINLAATEAQANVCGEKAGPSARFGMTNFDGCDEKRKPQT